MIRYLILAFMCCSSVYGQMLQTINNDVHQASGPAVVPAFVSSVIGGSTEWGESTTASNSITTRVSGTTTCANNAYCIQFPDAILSGNAVAIGYSYYQTSAQAPTVTDDKSNTYTCISEVNDATNNRFLGACYAFNITNGARNITITFAGGVGFGQAEAVQMQNVTSLRTSKTGSGSSTTTLSTSAASASTDDFIVQFTQITSPKNVFNTNTSLGTITFGSSPNWTGFAADYRDGMSGQIYIPPSAGSVTPTETNSTSVSYISVALDFASGTQGTAPSGLYIACAWYTNSVQGTTTSPTVQLPCPTGNALHASINGGMSVSSGVFVSSVTDSNATWFNGNTINNGVNGDTNFCANSPGAPGPFSCEFYATNWTPTNAEAPTFNMNWNGGSGAGNDVSIWAHAIAGASTVGSNPIGALQYDVSPGAGASFTLTSTYQPQTSSGLSFVVAGQNNNTTISQSGCSALLDSVTNGGEVLNGPWPLDENNWHGHCYNTNSNAVQTYTNNYTSSVTAAGATEAMTSSIASSTAQWAAQLKTCTSTANSLTCAVTQKASGDSLIAVAGSFNGTARTLTSVCNNGATCGAGHAMTCDAGSHSTNGSGGAAYICHFFATGLSGAQTWTVTWSGTVANDEITIYEVVGISAVATVSAGSNPAVTNSSGTQSCPSVTPNVNPTFIASIITTTGGISASPASGSLFTIGSGIFATTSDAWEAQETNVMTARTPTYTGSGTTGCSVEAFN